MTDFLHQCLSRARIFLQYDIKAFNSLPMSTHMVESHPFDTWENVEIGRTSRYHIIKPTNVMRLYTIDSVDIPYASVYSGSSSIAESAALRVLAYHPNSTKQNAAFHKSSKLFIVKVGICTHDSKYLCW